MNKIKLFSVLKFSFPYFALLCTVVCLFLTIPQNPIHPHYWGDSAIYEYVAKMMLNGQTLYKDVFDHKGPLVYWFQLPVLYIMSFTSKYINHQKLNAFDFFITGLMCITLSFLKLIYLAIPFVLLLYILIDAITRNSAKNIKNIFIYVYKNNNL